MLPRDQFDRRFDTVVAALAAWAATLRDVAHVAVEAVPGFWRLRLDPHARGPCPVELILHRNQTFDVMIASETYDGEPVEDLGFIEPLLKAIVAGDVTTKTVRSAATGRLTRTATAVGPALSPLFEREHTSGPDAETGLATVRHYPPYRRG